jgi:septal ring factor EnvC (AmiA/AmiB activator)
MDQLRKQVARARRRLIIEQFLARLIWCLLGTLSLAAIAIAVPRVTVVEGLPTNWDYGWFIGAFAAAVLFACIWTFLSNRSPIDAAIEIDRRFDLRERVASSLSLSPEEQTSEAGRAVVNDALRAVSRIDVDEKFRVGVGRRAWWPLVPAAVVFALVAFVDYRQASSSVDPAASAKMEQQTKNALESFRKKLEEQRKKLAEEKGLKAADDLFKQIEEGTRELSQKEKLDPSKAHVKLNDLAKELEQKRQRLGGDNALKEQLQKMKDLGAGPADKAAQAMKQGDWNKAVQEIDKLAKELREGKLDKAAQEQLAKQLQKMKERLEAAAEAHQQAMADLKKQIEEQKKAGNLAKAGELQQKLDQLQKQQPAMDRLQKLAQQMAQAQQGVQNADGKKAADAMAKMAQQLAQMQKDMDQMKALDAMMDQMELAKDAMACKNCNGKGCEECQGNMLGMNGGKNDPLDPNGKPGRNPTGQGPGIGKRPEDRGATDTRETQVRQNSRRGSATFGGLVEGPNIKGDVAQSIKEEMATRAAEPADPLTSDRLPNSRREQAEQYFQALREGK